MPFIVSPEGTQPHKKRFDIYETLVVVMIGFVAVGGFVSWKYFRVEEQSSSAYETFTPPPEAAYQETQTPTPEPTPTGTPRTNPFDDTNPFTNQYENPFE